MSRITIGLTGGIASGKSEVGRRFAALGVTVVDADAVAREVVMPGTPGLAAIVARFGEDVLQADGRLDRAALRRIVFADPQARRDLEAITHPAIRAAMIEQCLRAPGAYAIAAIPLLAEAGRSRYPWLREVVVVDVPVEVQLARLVARDDIDAGLARQMVQAQASRQQRLAIADRVIDNTGTPADLQAPVEALHRHFLALAEGTRD